MHIHYQYQQGLGSYHLKDGHSKIIQKKWQYSNFYTIPSSHIRIHSKPNYADTLSTKASSTVLKIAAQKH
jgi:hypothetical protein